jgi:hypothetical protein
MDDYGYDECLAEMASYGFSPYTDECEISYEEATAEMEWATSPEYQARLDDVVDDHKYDQRADELRSYGDRRVSAKDAASELASVKEEIAMDKLRARMIAALSRLVEYLMSNMSNMQK